MRVFEVAWTVSQWWGFDLLRGGRRMPDQRAPGGCIAGRASSFTMRYFWAVALSWIADVTPVVAPHDRCDLVQRLWP